VENKLPVLRSEVGGEIVHPILAHEALNYRAVGESKLKAK
jgi:hypothetical protein